MANLTVLDGSSFFVSDAAGDVDPTTALGPDVMGLFHSDVRHLAGWELLINGQRMRVLTSRPNDYYSARVFGALAAGQQEPAIAVRRERIVADGVHEDVWLTNNSSEPVTVRLEMRFGADFADLLSVKDGRPMRGRTGVDVDGKRVTLRCRNRDYERATTITFDVPGDLSEDRMCWDLTIGPRQEWTTCIDIGVVVDGKEVNLRTGHGGMGSVPRTRRCRSTPRSRRARCARSPNCRRPSTTTSATPNPARFSTRCAAASPATSARRRTRRTTAATTRPRCS
jgi:hypothetical protein